MVRALLDGTKTQTRRVVKCHVEDYGIIRHTATVCPYGYPGDRLWVRETFRQYPDGIFYRADANDIELANDVHRPWKPSIFMPRAASRITLEITAVRLARLQDISEVDVTAEGIQEIIDAGVDHDGWPRDAYRSLWDSINGPDSWDANPWVWVVEFKVVKS